MLTILITLRIELNLRMMKKLLLLLLLIPIVSFGQDYNLISDLNYYSSEISKADSYISERCELDLYYPSEKKNFPTIIFFHGGGLKNGEKFIPEYLKEKGVAVVTPNYRLHPKVKAPKYIEDAAASIAWVFNNIENYGGNKSLIFVSGSSAGGYLTSMVGLDKSWLEKFNIDANDIAGLIPLTGHTITHFTVRNEMGISNNTPIIDSLAPLYHVREDAPPILLITGDRNLEMLGRYEENAYFMRMLKNVGHKNVEHYELDGYGHGISHPAMPLLLKNVKKISNSILKKNIK